ncbi:MAG: PqqD family protein [Thermoanaerobaculales bacterium]
MSRTLDLSQLLSSEGISHTKLADNTGVILDVESLQVFSLNETGLFLVEALRDGISDHQSLVRRMVEEFEVDEETASSDVDAFVEELAGQLVDRNP